MDMKKILTAQEKARDIFKTPVTIERIRLLLEEYMWDLKGMVAYQDTPLAEIGPTGYLDQVTPEQVRKTGAPAVFWRDKCGREAVSFLVRHGRGDGIYNDGVITFFERYKGNKNMICTAGAGMGFHGEVKSLGLLEFYLIIINNTKWGFFYHQVEKVEMHPDELLLKEIESLKETIRNKDKQKQNKMNASFASPHSADSAQSRV